MKITLKDGSSKEYAQPMSVYEIALDISEGLARVATAGEIDGEEVDLRTVVDKDCELNKEKELFVIQHLILWRRRLKGCIPMRNLRSDRRSQTDFIMI